MPLCVETALCPLLRSVMMPKKEDALMIVKACFQPGFVLEVTLRPRVSAHVNEATKCSQMT